MVLDLTYIHQDELILKLKNNHFKNLGMEKVDIAILIANCGEKKIDNLLGIFSFFETPS